LLFLSQYKLYSKTVSKSIDRKPKFSNYQSVFLVNTLVRQWWTVKTVAFSAIIY